MKETCATFGQDLAGIVTAPDGAPRRVGCLWISAGLVPKFGPYRLYTQVARRLARAGFISLRFDLAGIGDSPRASTGETLQVRTEREIDAALTHLLANHDLDGVILGGLCSGAADAFRHAEHDARVKGLVLIDPFAHATADARLRFLALRGAGRLLRYAGVYAPRPRAMPGGTDGRVVKYHYMEPPESSRILAAVTARGVRTCFVYTGGMRASFNHERQLASMFPGVALGDRVTVDLFARSDHTQFLEEDRAAITFAIAARIEQAFPT
jgi:pimeloyl-ACP methyl ester carboxylesterase